MLQLMTSGWVINWLEVAGKQHCNTSVIILEYLLLTAKCPFVIVVPPWVKCLFLYEVDIFIWIDIHSNFTFLLNFCFVFFYMFYVLLRVFFFFANMKKTIGKKNHLKTKGLGFSQQLYSHHIHTPLKYTCWIHRQSLAVFPLSYTRFTIPISP